MTTSNPPFRILVVDDSALARQLIVAVLHKMGLTQIDEADGGKVAFLQIRQGLVEKRAFDLVLCDWNMPEVDGMALLQSCRAVPELTNLAFVMITAEGGREKIFEALTSGSADYLVKPFKPETLQKKVLQIIERIKKSQASA